MAVKSSKVLESEVMNKAVTFEVREVEFTIPPAKEWELDVVRAHEDGRLVNAVEALVKDQLTAFRKVVKNMGDLEEFATALFDAVDVDPKA